MLVSAHLGRVCGELVSSTPLSLIFRPQGSSNQSENFQTRRRRIFPCWIVFTAPPATSTTFDLNLLADASRRHPGRPHSSATRRLFCLPSCRASQHLLIQIRSAMCVLTPLFSSLQNKPFNPAFLAAVITRLIGPRLTFPLGAAADADGRSRPRRSCTRLFAAR